MTRRALALVLLAALLPAAPASAGTADDPAATVDAFHFALKARDRRAAMMLLSPEVVVFDQGRVERSRASYAGKSMKEDMEFAALTRRTVSRREVKTSKDMAWVVSLVRITGKINNRPVDVATDETMLLRREGGRWQIQHIHWSFSSNKGGL